MGCPVGESRLYGKRGAIEDKEIGVVLLPFHGWLKRMALMLTLVATAGAFALPAAGQQPTHVRAQLLAESSSPEPGRSTSVALSMMPDKGWHGYWVNGGDAGFGLTVKWNLPEGVTLLPFRYPVPQTLVISGLMNHVYEHPYALLADLHVDKSVAPGTDLTLSGVANWLACTDEVCVPEHAVIAVKLTAGDGKIPAPSRAQFDGWRAHLPQPLDRAGHWERQGSRLRFAVPLPASTTFNAPHLFLKSQNVIAYSAAQTFSRQGDWIIIESRSDGDATGAVTGLLKLDDGRGLEVQFEPGTVPRAGEPVVAPHAASIDASLFWTALAGAILGGLILNLMPCVFPILSLKALSLARAGGEPREAKIEALAYTAGAVLVALALGSVLLALRAAGEQIGWAFQLQHPVSVFILLALAIAITLNLLGIYELRSFGGGHALAGKGGAAGGFWTGALAAFVATPCSGPLLGAALGATLALPAWAALPIFGGLGLGLAIPFLAIGFIPSLRNLMPKPGSWMARFRRWMALPMGLTALALVWLLWRQAGAQGLASGILALLSLSVIGWSAGSRQRRSKAALPILAIAVGVCFALALPLASIKPAAVGAEAAGRAYSATALIAARSTGKPVFVYFTADWCLSCKANEAGAIERAATQKAFDAAGVITLVGDWTNGDPAITRTLAEHGRNSVPLYLWYAPGSSEPDILPQILTPGLLADKAAAR